jgi:RNA polymerase sigma-70 factor (ECF subfamily)
MGLLQRPKPELFKHFGLDTNPVEELRPDDQADCTLHGQKEKAIEEEELVTLASSADPRKAIFTLYDEYRPRLLRYLGSLRLTRDQAEETIQETFLRLTTELAEGKEIENVQGWIVRVAHNLAIDVRKRTERDAVTRMDLEEMEIQHPLVDPGATPFEKYQQEERLHHMEAALVTLTAQQLQCFHMRVEGFRYKDIAGALGISEQRAALVLKQVAVKLAAVCV